MPLTNAHNIELLDPSRAEDVSEVEKAMLTRPATGTSMRSMTLIAIGVATVAFMVNGAAPSLGVSPVIVAVLAVMAIRRVAQLLAAWATGVREPTAPTWSLIGSLPGSTRQRAIQSLVCAVAPLAVAIPLLHLDLATGPVPSAFVWYGLVLGAGALTPAQPLDGGSFIDATLLSRAPYLRSVWWQASAALWVGAAWWLELWIFGGLAVYVYFRGVGVGMHVAVAEAIRSSSSPRAPLPETITPAVIRVAIAELNQRMFAHSRRPVSADNYVTALRKGWPLAKERPPGAMATMVLLSAYALALALGAYALTLAFGWG